LIIISSIIFINLLSGEKFFHRRKPNIILISIDTLRADHLNCYGYARKTSPNINALALKGVLFLNAISLSPKTTPSHMSIMTSLHHDVHQVQMFEDNKPGKRLNDSIPTLAEILKKSGYVTVAFTAGGHMHASRGFDKGFDAYAHNNAIEKVISWLHSNYKKSFFLFFHTYVVHDPYLPPPPYNRMYDSDYSGNIIDSRNRLIKILGDDKEWQSKHKAFWESVNKESLRDVDFLKALYDGAIYFMDETIVKVLIQELKELNIFEDTIIIFTSDHGEAFNEHGNFLHRDIFWETLHVPLIIVYPKIIPKNIKIGQLVRLIDIMPTIFDLLGLKKHIFMQGESLLPAIHGINLDLSCYSSWRNFIGMTTNEYAYIKNKETEYLYDRQKDTVEKYNIIANEPQVAYELKKKLFEQKQFCEELAPDFTPTEEVLPDQETVKKLKTLGYLQ
ncbi:MAG: sulfatase, partial [Candidatus Omnitrophica bacterium]|nr:sulfatase [Candidatus Omnitrophota bacterium]